MRGIQKSTLENFAKTVDLFAMDSAKNIFCTVLDSSANFQYIKLGSKHIQCFFQNARVSKLM